MMADIGFCFCFMAILTTYLGSISCTSEEVADENLKKLASANNELAFKMLRQLASQSSENIFFSPLSLSTAFGMLYYGTKGITAKELGHVLGYDAVGLPEELVHPTFQHYLTETLPSQDPNSYALNSANAAILSKNFEVYSSYVKDIQEYYQATVKQVDFTTSNQVVHDVNNWIKNKTKGKIDNALHNLDPSTCFVILNAVYFKGSWQTKFQKSKTFLQKFFNKGLESEAKEVPMMSMKARFRYTANLEHKFKVIEMPYKGENISMVIFLPHERDGLGALEKKMSLEIFKDIRREHYKFKLSLTLPKFKVEYSKDMCGDFIALGAQSTFSLDADFSGISKNNKIRVSEVLHKAVIEVNEEDSEAVAFTRIGVGKSKSNLKFIVDHPFLFAIVDKRNDMILFLGRVTKL